MTVLQAPPQRGHCSVRRFSLRTGRQARIAPRTQIPDSSKAATWLHGGLGAVAIAAPPGTRYASVLGFIIAWRVGEIPVITRLGVTSCIRYVLVLFAVQRTEIRAARDPTTSEPW